MPKIPQGAVYKPAQALPAGATFDAPAPVQTLDPKQEGMQPAANYSLWDRVKSLVPQSNSYGESVGQNVKQIKDFHGALASDVKDMATSPSTYLGPAVSGGVDAAKQLYGMFSRGSMMPPPGEGGVSLKSIGGNVGVNTQGVEDESNKGNLAGVLGHAALPLGLVTGGAAATKGGVADTLTDVKGAYRQATVPGTPTELLTRATKPTVGLNDYATSLDKTVPEIYARAKAAKAPVKSLSDLESGANNLKADKLAEFLGLRDQVTSPVDLSGAADMQDNSLPARAKFEDVAGKRQESLSNRAASYRRSVPVQEADALRVGTNAELRNFWNKAGGDQQAALQNPETSRIFAVNKGVRNAEYDAIKDATGQDPAPIQDLFGHAQDVADTAGRRNTVFSRQQPVGVADEITNLAALSHPGTGLITKLYGMFAKKANSPDFLTKEAFERYGRSQKKPQISYGAIANAMARKSK